jgi:hypothetical protein
MTIPPADYDATLGRISLFPLTNSAARDGM